MKISVLNQCKKAPHRILNGIDCDDVSFDPPEGLLWAGFVLDVKKQKSGMEISENLIDTMVAWSTIGNGAKNLNEKIECILELNYKEDWSPEDVIHWASSGEFNVSLQGWRPSDSEEELEKYNQRLFDLVSHALKINNFSKNIFPFSLIFENIFLELSDKKEDALRIREDWACAKVDVINPRAAKTEYALLNNPINQKGTQETCKRALIEHFGGEDALKEVVDALRDPIMKKISDFHEEIKQKPKNKHERFHLDSNKEHD